MALNEPHPMLMVAWVVSQTKEREFIWLWDSTIAAKFRCPVTYVRQCCDLGVKTGFLRRSDHGKHARYSFEPDEEKAFWREMDFRDRHGMFKESPAGADE